MKFLHDCLKGSLKDLYSTVKEGNRSFVAQVCSIANGRYLALVVYGGEKRSNLICISENLRDQGWQGMVGHSGRLCL